MLGRFHHYDLALAETEAELREALGMEDLGRSVFSTRSMPLVETQAEGPILTGASPKRWGHVCRLGRGRSL